MNKTLKLVLTDHWFEEIKSGRKTHEYRKANTFWYKRILPFMNFLALSTASFSVGYSPLLVQFQKAYRKNPERMTFEIDSITIIDGERSDLNCIEDVFDIKLGERVK